MHSGYGKGVYVTVYRNSNYPHFKRYYYYNEKMTQDSFSSLCESCKSEYSGQSERGVSSKALELHLVCAILKLANIYIEKERVADD